MYYYCSRTKSLQHLWVDGAEICRPPKCYFSYGDDHAQYVSHATSRRLTPSPIIHAIQEQRVKDSGSLSFESRPVRTSFSLDWPGTMAHQAHNIPWNIFTSNFCWVPRSSHRFVTPSLHLRGKPTQAKELQYFVEAVARNLDEHSACERKKYPEAYDPPAREDLLIDDETTKKISPSVYRAEIDFNGAGVKPYRGGLCGHKGEAECSCAVPYEKRKVSSFLHPYQENDCYKFKQVNGLAFSNLELTKILVMHGEMSPVLRLCAHPDVHLRSWFSVQECCCIVSDLGRTHRDRRFQGLT